MEKGVSIIVDINELCDTLEQMLEDNYESTELAIVGNKLVVKAVSIESSDNEEYATIDSCENEV